MDPLSDPDVEAAWSTEIGRRLSEIDAGLGELIPWDVVRSELLGDCAWENHALKAQAVETLLT